MMRYLYFLFPKLNPLFFITFFNQKYLIATYNNIQILKKYKTPVHILFFNLFISKGIFPKHIIIIFIIFSIIKYIKTKIIFLLLFFKLISLININIKMFYNFIDINPIGNYIYIHIHIHILENFYFFFSFFPEDFYYFLQIDNDI
jgi:hypothetical protein